LAPGIPDTVDTAPVDLEMQLTTGDSRILTFAAAPVCRLKPLNSKPGRYAT